MQENEYVVHRNYSFSTNSWCQLIIIQRWDALLHLVLVQNEVESCTKSVINVLMYYHHT